MQASIDDSASTVIITFTSYLHHLHQMVFVCYFFGNSVLFSMKWKMLPLKVSLKLRTSKPNHQLTIDINTRSLCFPALAVIMRFRATHPAAANDRPKQIPLYWKCPWSMMTSKAALLNFFLKYHFTNHEFPEIK